MNRLGEQNSYLMESVVNAHMLKVTSYLVFMDLRAPYLDKLTYWFMSFLSQRESGLFVQDKMGEIDSLSSK